MASSQFVTDECIYKSEFMFLLVMVFGHFLQGVAVLCCVVLSAISSLLIFFKLHDEKVDFATPVLGF